MYKKEDAIWEENERINKSINPAAYQKKSGNMKALKYIKKTREYLDYLEEHIKNVEKAWNVLKGKCTDMRFIYDDFVYHSVDKEIELHDLSKLSEWEFVQYRQAFFPIETEGKYDMSEAWEHHKEENPHHWETWTRLNDENPNDPYTWEINCVHMVVDWMAMGYRFGDTAQKYYEANKNKIDLPEYAISLIYDIFKRLD